MIGEVTLDIAAVSQASEATNYSSMKINEGSIELSKIAEDLNFMISKFKI